MLKHGIRGGSKWLGEKEWLGENNIVDTAFQTESEEDANEVIEKLRHEITAPIASFKEKTKGRKTAAEFEGVYETYGKMRNTLAATFAANLDQANFYAQVRNFSSAREMYLYGSNIPESVYDNLIETVHKNMESYS